MDGLSVALTFGIGAFVLWHPATTSLATQMAYRTRREQLSFSPSPIVFGLVWPVLYLLIAVNLILFFNDRHIVEHHNSTYIAVFVLAIINLLLEKTWVIFYNAVFAKADASLGGLVFYTFLVFATALTLLILEATVSGEELWWSIVFFLGPYVLWTAYATILMAQFATTYYVDVGEQ